MKKLFLIAIAAIAFTTASQAQTDSSFHNKMKGEHGANMQRKNMWNDLNLTQDQKDQMKKLHDDNKAKMDALKNNTTLSADDKKAQMKTLRDEQRKNMESVLTDEQKTKMKQLHDERKSEHKAWKANKDSTSTQK